MAMWTIALPGNADYASYSRNPDVMDFVGWVADYVDSNTVRGRTGWESHLRAYSEPDGSSWLMGCLKRLSYHQLLRHTAGMRPAANYVVFRDIVVNWGRMPKMLSLSDCRRVASSLPILVRSPNAVDEDVFISHRIAALSKIYEMHDPTKWIVFDSRVGWALQMFLKWRYSDASAVPGALRIRCPHGRTRTPPLGMGLSSAGQTRKMYYAASWLHRLLAQELNARGILLPRDANPSGAGWEAYHVEMVMFVVGKEMKSVKTRHAQAMTVQVRRM